MELTLSFANRQTGDVYTVKLETHLWSQLSTLILTNSFEMYFITFFRYILFITYQWFLQFGMEKYVLT